MTGIPLDASALSSKSASDRLLAVLSAFALQPDWDLSSLASHLGFPKSTVHRLLNDLKRQGYVRQLPDSSRYALGYELARVANAVSPNNILKAVAHPYLVELAEATGETAFLLVSDGAAAVCLGLAEPRSPIRYSVSVGSVSPLGKGSSGQVLLAFEVPAVRERVLFGLNAAERKGMELSLAQVRAQGWAYTVGELTPGTGAISVPIFSSAGQLAGCLALGGPEARLSRDVAVALYPRLRDQATAISAAL